MDTTSDRTSTDENIEMARVLASARPVLVPLLELFATCDEVFDEQGAFDPNAIHKSLGRVYRVWLTTRSALDPSFDSQKYRQEMKGSAAKRTPLGREQPAKARRTSSTDPKSTSAKNRNRTGSSEKPSASKSVRRAQSETRVSGGQSSTKKSTEFGAGSRSGKGTVSKSGSVGKATARRQKARG